jgi:putative copper export protein
MGVAIIEGLHMLFATFWFGGTLFVNFVLGPATARTSPAAAGEMGVQIGIQANRVIPPVAGLAILLGFLRGTVWGPIDSLSAVFNTGFGRWWFIALVLAIITFLWGERLTGPAAASIGTATTAEERVARVQTTLRLASLELVGFLGIFSMMILMRFYP